MLDELYFLYNGVVFFQSRASRWFVVHLFVYIYFLITLLPLDINNIAIIIRKLALFMEPVCVCLSRSLFSHVYFFFSFLLFVFLLPLASLDIKLVERIIRETQAPLHSLDEDKKCRSLIYHCHTFQFHFLFLHLFASVDIKLRYEGDNTLNVNTFLHRR